MIGLALCEKGQVPHLEDQSFLDLNQKIFAVADGFGGPVPGKQAADLAIESVVEFLRRGSNDRDVTLPYVIRRYYSLAGNVLFNSILHANQKLMKANRDKSVHERGGASILAGYFDGQLLALAQVGACSAWMIRDEKVSLLLQPRTLARLKDPSQSELNRDLQVPLMSLGVTDDLEPEIFEFQVRQGDWILLQSAGIRESERQRIAQIQGLGIGESEALEQVREALGSADTDLNSSISLVIV